MRPAAETGPLDAASAAETATAARICVIADDLTGAADAGVAFVRRDREVTIVLRCSAPGPGPVTVVDTDTREASPARSGAAVRRLAAQVRPRDHVLKKVDSLLRGQVAAELAALRGALPGRMVIAAPAVPALGRVTIGGIIRAQRLGPPQEPGQARVPAPMAGIPMAARLGGPACVIGLAQVRSDALALGRSLAAARAAGLPAACDAVTDQDLDGIVAAGLALDFPVLWVGAAGLAAALARAVLGRPDRGPAEPPRAPAPLLIIGSHSPVARAQVSALLACGAQGIGLRAGDLLAMPERERYHHAARIARASAAATTVVWLDGEVDGVGRPDVAAALGELCAPAVMAARVVVAAGGATARAALIPAGVAALTLQGELEPGVVLARAAPLARPRHALHVVTKSGSFGDPATLVRLAAVITQPKGAP
jgi:D-threonate/D-erythronate kinase